MKHMKLGELSSDFIVRMQEITIICSWKFIISLLQYNQKSLNSRKLISHLNCDGN